jgi:hypothetical protein
MKMIYEHLEQAAQFERLAADERDTAFKAKLLEQAEAYRKLAADRAKTLHVPLPDRRDGKG